MLFRSKFMFPSHDIQLQSLKQCAKSRSYNNSIIILRFKNNDSNTLQHNTHFNTHSTADWQRHGKHELTSNLPNNEHLNDQHLKQNLQNLNQHNLNLFKRIPNHQRLNHNFHRSNLNHHHPHTIINSNPTTEHHQLPDQIHQTTYRDWETDRKSTRLNSSHEIPSRMPSSA